MITFIINSKIATEKEMASVLWGRERLLTSTVNSERFSNFTKHYAMVWQSGAVGMKDEIVISCMDSKTEKTTTMRVIFSDNVRFVVTTGSTVHYVDYEIPSEKKLGDIMERFF